MTGNKLSGTKINHGCMNSNQHTYESAMETLASAMKSLRLIAWKPWMLAAWESLWTTRKSLLGAELPWLLCESLWTTRKSLLGAELESWWDSWQSLVLLATLQPLLWTRLKSMLTAVKPLLGPRLESWWNSWEAMLLLATKRWGIRVRRPTWVVVTRYLVPCWLLLLATLLL